MSPESQPPSGFARFLRALLRIFLFLIICVILAVGAYFGFQYLYQQAIVPAQESRMEANSIKTSVDTSLNETSQRMETLQQRIDALELQQTQDAETIAQLQAELEIVREANTRQDDTLKRLDDLSQQVTSLRATMSLANQQIDGVQNLLTASDSPLATLEREVQLLKVMGMLNRSRLSLTQNNYGLAEQQIEEAMSILVRLIAQTPSPARDTLSAWVVRLQTAKDNLPANPILAADDMELVWQMISTGLNDPAGILPTPWVTPTPTPWISPTPWETPTPTPYNPFTPTPWDTPTPWVTTTPIP